MDSERFEHQISQFAALVFAITVLLGTLLRPIFATQSAMYTILGIANFLLAFVVYLLIKRRYLIKYAGICVVLTTQVCLLPLLLVSGGVNSQFIVLIPLVPIFTSFICRVRFMWLIGVVNMLGILAMHYYHFLLTDLDGDTIGSQKANAKTFWLIAATFISAGFGHYYRKQNTRLKNLLTKHAYIDVLTEIANRRQIESTLQKEIARAKRHHKTLSILLIDIDYFKSINDNYGHDAGDACLKQIAEKLSLQIRKSDAVGRFGGEEFLLIFPNTTVQELAILANKLVDDVATTPFEYKNYAHKLTISAGGATMHGQLMAERDVAIAETMIKQADKALYHCKNNGRNQFHSTTQECSEI